MKKSWLFWTPRILTILFILFLALFALDVFGNGYTFWQTIGALFLHLIPNFILIIILIIAWKHELVGAIAFALAGLAYIVTLITRSNFQLYMLSWSFIIAGPAFAIAVLYYLNYKNKKRR